MLAKSNTNYRWYMLTLAMLTYGVIAGLARLCLPVLFKEISVDLKLDPVAIGTIWGLDPLAGVFIGLPSGLLADRFGVKRTLTILCLLAGIFSALRGFSVNFFSLGAFTFLFGFTAAAVPSIVPKVAAEWFSGQQLGLTNALLNVAWSIGAIIATMFSATVFSPLLHGWRNVIFLYSAPIIALGLLWMFTGREPDGTAAPETAASRIPFRQALSRVVRIKEVWIIGLILLTGWGATSGFVGYLPLYLRNIGWTTASADGAFTVYNAVCTAGSIPMVLLADKLHMRRGILIITMVAMSALLILLPFVNPLGVYLLIIVCGFIRSGSGPLLTVMIFELKNVGSAYGGTAYGLACALGMLGAFLGPPLGNSLESINQGLPFIFWGCLSVLSIPLFLLIKNKPDRG
jgi:NNP family nitrate/nitrite transporter-like MFS transporter